MRLTTSNCVPVVEVRVDLRWEENCRHTSKKPDIKFCGSLAVGSSSARKYFKMCGSCFQ